MQDHSTASTKVEELSVISRSHDATQARDGFTQLLQLAKSFHATDPLTRNLALNTIIDSCFTLDLPLTTRTLGLRSLSDYIDSDEAAGNLCLLPLSLDRLQSLHRLIGPWFNSLQGPHNADLTSVDHNPDLAAYRLCLLQLMRNLSLHKDARRILRSNQTYLNCIQSYVLDTDFGSATPSSDPANPNAISNLNATANTTNPTTSPDPNPQNNLKTCAASQSICIAIIRNLYTPATAPSISGDHPFTSLDLFPHEISGLWQFDRWLPHVALVRMVRLPDGRTFWPNIEAGRLVCCWARDPHYAKQLLLIPVWRPLFVFTLNARHPKILQEAADAVRCLFTMAANPLPQPSLSSTGSLESPADLAHGRQVNPVRHQVCRCPPSLVSEWAHSMAADAIAAWLQYGAETEKRFALGLLLQWAVSKDPSLDAIYQSATSVRDLKPCLEALISSGIEGARAALMYVEKRQKSPSADLGQKLGEKERKSK
eukprot:TRINITY_DN4840_c0_g1_i1.p1 TRINITY_DN4840_c0_g1~~TRINITY_DN4840_c0_g1_i1.p1  ORF type:complete len:483 (+),score=102.26 TRINITY_DN4840_c0_g1_i1:43-1491(+)